MRKLARSSPVCSGDAKETTRPSRTPSRIERQQLGCSRRRALPAQPRPRRLRIERLHRAHRLLWGSPPAPDVPASSMYFLSQSRHAELPLRFVSGNGQTVLASGNDSPAAEMIEALHARDPRGQQASIRTCARSAGQVVAQNSPAASGPGRRGRDLRLRSRSLRGPWLWSFISRAQPREPRAQHDHPLHRPPTRKRLDLVERLGGCGRCSYPRQKSTSSGHEVLRSYPDRRLEQAATSGT